MMVARRDPKVRVEPRPGMTSFFMSPNRTRLGLMKNEVEVRTSIFYEFVKNGINQDFERRIKREAHQKLPLALTHYIK